MDVDRAAELYVAGWTLRRIGAELGVDHRTVAVRLHRAGVTMRRGGAPRYEVDTQRILDLRDQGLGAPSDIRRCECPLVRPPQS